MRATTQNFMTRLMSLNLIMRCLVIAVLLHLSLVVILHSIPIITKLPNPFGKVVFEPGKVDLSAAHPDIKDSPKDSMHVYRPFTSKVFESEPNSSPVKGSGPASIFDEPASGELPTVIAVVDHPTEITKEVNYPTNKAGTIDFAVVANADGSDDMAKLKATTRSRNAAISLS